MFTEILLYGLIAIATFVHAQTQTQILSNGTSIEVNQGTTALFECQVRNLKTGQTVVWHFVDHNVTISTGDVIRSDSNWAQKYSIYRPQDEGGANYWNLAINSVESTDVGTYQCYVNNSVPLAKVTYHLTVKGLTPTQSAPHFNVTDCCKRVGVETCALPLCDTSTSLTDVINIASDGTCMENNLIQVLNCGQDGRNHLGCCMRRGMSDLCLNLCDGYGEADGTDYTSCIGIPTISLVECLKEGQYALPSQPTAVSAVNLGEKLLVSWQPPDDNPDLVTSYKVQYRVTGESTYNSQSVTSRAPYTVVLTGLQLDKIYEIRVIALASSGASQPSYAINIATGVVNTASQRNDTIADCCKRNHVTTDCQIHCSADRFFMGGDSASLLGCHSQLYTMYNCLAGYGNHTPCCQRVNVPEKCYRLCQGEVVLSWDIVSCMTYMPLISACMIEGSAILPDPPKNTHIQDGSVTYNSAIIAWDKSDNYQQGEEFIVSWKLHYSDLPQWSSARVVAGTSYQITNLKPATMYNVIVSTVNDKGSSLPELTLILITEGESGEIPTPFNETMCCSERGVAAECLNLCVHEFRITDNMTMLFELGLKCPDALAPMLLCGSDGRNHTDCCISRGVSGSCLDLCSLNHDSVLGTDSLTCLMYKNELSYCYDEGKKILPRPPVDVTAKAIDIYSITIDWSPPEGPNVTKYLVQSSLDAKYWENQKNVSQTYLEVTELKSDTNYYFRVFSVNSDGQSLPSTVIGAYTLPVTVNGTHERNWMMLWNSKQDCCAKSSNVTICQDGCINGEDIDLVQCAVDMDRIVACGADGRDHTKCCSRYPNFPEQCLPYCKGQPGNRDVTAALCLHYVSAMFACFVEGKGLIPSPPQTLTAVASNSSVIQMKWMPPAENCATNCSYTVLLWTDEGQELQHKKVINETRYLFSGLKEETLYRVSVTASNKYGSSLPSPYLIILTKSDVLGSVSIKQNPIGVIQQGDPVQISCEAFGQGIIKVELIRNSRSVGIKQVLKIEAVTDQDSGVYTCRATYSDNTVTMSKTQEMFLNVQFTPHPVKMYAQHVLPGVRLDSDIECVFTGFPDIVTWTKDGQALQGGAKYLLPPLVKLVPDSKGKTSSTLRVKNVISDDFGSYTCNATNKFGSNSITGSLQNIFPDTGLPPSVPPEQRKIQECCKNKGVPDKCAEKICTYAININVIISDPTLTFCLSYLEEFFYCGSDGKNHSKCCIEGGVDDFCLPMCAGRLPDHSDSIELLACMSNGETILNCAVNAIQYVPAAPVDVKARLYFDTVQVTWDYGVNADRVDVYHVWFQSGPNVNDFGGVMPLDRSYKVPSSFVKKGDTISVWVVAQNDFGSSHASNNATVKVTSLVPIKPDNLRGDLIDSTSIHVKWDPPKTQLKIIKYSVYFKNMGGLERVVNTISSETRLVKLLPKTVYVIQVAAVSADGVGQKTEVIHVTTGEATTPSVITDQHSQSGGQSSEKTGIVVGVILGLLFLLAVIVVAVLLFRRLKSPSPASQGPVSFENPQYANGQRVTGLPGDSAENNQFNYGKLNEEQDIQHDYLTLEPQTQPSNAPPTLNVDEA